MCLILLGFAACSFIIVEITSDIALLSCESIISSGWCADSLFSGDRPAGVMGIPGRDGVRSSITRAPRDNSAAGGGGGRGGEMSHGISGRYIYLSTP